MGQKTHPVGLRLGIVQPWRSRWFSTKNMPGLLKEDELIRRYLKTRLGHAAIAQVDIERKPTKVILTIHTGRPGVVIGKRGAEVDKLRDELAQLTGKDYSHECDTDLRANAIRSEFAECLDSLLFEYLGAKCDNHTVEVCHLGFALLLRHCQEFFAGDRTRILTVDVAVKVGEDVQHDRVIHTLSLSHKTKCGRILL